MSSVYYFYDPAYLDYNIGTVGALIEIEWIKRMSRYFPEFKYYYMGYYIQNTPKMVYKGEYEPSELLCPITFSWVELNDEIRKMIDDITAKKIPSPRLSTNSVTKVADYMSKVTSPQ